MAFYFRFKYITLMSYATHKQQKANTHFTFYLFECQCMYMYLYVNMYSMYVYVSLTA